MNEKHLTIEKLRNELHKFSVNQEVECTIKKKAVEKEDKIKYYKKNGIVKLITDNLIVVEVKKNGKMGLETFSSYEAIIEKKVIAI